MLLRGREGNELELAVEGYQFPAEWRDPWDSNWLLVSLRVVGPEGSWAALDPCLTTWEAAEMVRWLAAVAGRADLVAGRPLSLSEPNVTLTAGALTGADDRVALRACFALERRPPWVRTAAGLLCVDLDVDRAQLARAAADLRGDLERFPQRGDDPTL